MSTGAAGVLAWSGAATVTIGALAVLGSGALAQAEAASAADLAALAGADALVAGTADPCTVAGEAAQRNGAVLLGCTRSGSEVFVEVGVSASPLPPMTATARAGPPPGQPP